MDRLVHLRVRSRITERHSHAYLPARSPARRLPVPGFGRREEHLSAVVRLLNNHDG